MEQLQEQATRIRCVPARGYLLKRATNNVLKDLRGWEQQPDTEWTRIQIAFWIMYHNSYHTAYVQHLAMIGSYSCDCDHCLKIKSQPEKPQNPRYVDASYADHHHP
ncbi:hypothetical protein JTB14_007746 [Gonioctena quinquepunctata]|nr:hypothetical protein JTB14_007746 [Gonioctena quinquepunctata]